MRNKRVASTTVEKQHCLNKLVKLIDVADCIGQVRKTTTLDQWHVEFTRLVEAFSRVKPPGLAPSNGSYLLHHAVKSLMVTANGGMSLKLNSRFPLSKFTKCFPDSKAHQWELPVHI